MALRTSAGLLVLVAGVLVAAAAIRPDGSAVGPAPARDEAVDNHLTLQHTTLVVSDFEASMEFYLGVLGLERIDAPFLPENQAFIALGDGLELHVGEVPGVEIRPMEFNHFAITARDFDAFLAHLLREGVTYSDLGGEEARYVQTRGDGVRQTFFQDPDGYWIEVNDFPGEGAR